LVDADPAIAMQTVAELRFGALDAGWGARGMAELEALVNGAVVIPVDDEVAWAHARLRTACLLVPCADSPRLQQMGGVSKRAPS